MRWLTEFFESLRIAAAAIKANKARGVLTTLGIIIGIVAVVTTMTAANGLANNFKESISTIGTDVLYVSKMPWIITGNFFEYRDRKNLELKHAEKLADRLRGQVTAVSPGTSSRQNVKYNSAIMESVPIIGTTDKQLLVGAEVPEYGRFLIETDVQFKKRVCVLGAEIRENLFGDVDPINKEIKIGRSTFRVVGIMESQGGAGFFGGPNFDRRITVPVTTLIKTFGGANRNFDIAVKAANQESLDDLEYAVIGEMRKIRKLSPKDGDNFSINTMDSLVDVYNNVMGVVVLIGLVITGVSLFVGGIGVMNIMFVSVTERTREIGIRKAIGAKKRVILAQFLFESSMICLIGGLAGLLLAFGVTEAINAFLLPASLSPFIALVAIAVSISVGVVAGIIPAFKAARLNPIEALRYE